MPHFILKVVMVRLNGKIGKSDTTSSPILVLLNNSIKMSAAQTYLSTKQSKNKININFRLFAISKWEQMRCNNNKWLQTIQQTVVVTNSIHIIWECPYTNWLLEAKLAKIVSINIGKCNITPWSWLLTIKHSH